MTDKRKDSGFVVKDKRILAEGNGEDKKEPPVSSVDKKPDTQENAASSCNQTDYPTITFTNFILSLSTSALFHFGDFPDPASGKQQKNLSAAKQTIDMLDMVSEKTKGNLDEQETNLLQGVLYELKMRYVKENG